MDKLAQITSQLQQAILKQDEASHQQITRLQQHLLEAKQQS